jgi:arginyl-tRNA synthetase
MPNDALPTSEQAEYIGECYSKGSNLYETDEGAKKEINEINKKVYDKSDKKINEIYYWGRKVTLEAFEEIYKVLGTKFDRYFFESEMALLGQKIVEKNISNIFEKSDGATIFHAEKYDAKLHTRVFINSQGLPTYESKEIGLTMTKFKSGIFSKKLDLSIVTTAVEQAEYMKVVQKAISIMHPDLEKRMTHITHGMMRFATGKMSSRTGNVVTGESLIKDSKREIEDKIKDRNFTDKEKKEISKIVGIAALKYSILKQSVGGDIIYDFEKSISFEGDSGPYLQYSYTRAKSILEKAKKENIKSSYTLPKNWEIQEVEKVLYKFPEIVLHSTEDFEPHYIANYLIELARAFNGFYGNTQIVKSGDEASSYKVALTEAFSIVMKKGLYLLGIETPERM